MVLPIDSVINRSIHFSKEGRKRRRSLRVVRYLFFSMKMYTHSCIDVALGQISSLIREILFHEKMKVRPLTNKVKIYTWLLICSEKVIIDAKGVRGCRTVWLLLPFRRRGRLGLGELNARMRGCIERSERDDDVYRFRWVTSGDVR